MLPAYNIYAGLDYFFAQSGNLRDTVSFAVFTDYCFKNLSLLKNIAPPFTAATTFQGLQHLQPHNTFSKKGGGP